MRLSIPFPGSRYYIAVVGGKERRNALRRETERSRHPLLTRGNIVLIALLSMFGAMLGASLLTSPGFGTSAGTDGLSPPRRKPPSLYASSKHVYQEPDIARSA